MNSKCSVAHFTFMFKHDEFIWNIEMIAIYKQETM